MGAGRNWEEAKTYHYNNHSRHFPIEQCGIRSCREACRLYASIERRYPHTYSNEPCAACGAEWEREPGKTGLVMIHAHDCAYIAETDAEEAERTLLERE